MFDGLSKNLLICFQNNHSNSCCLMTMAHVVFKMGKNSPVLTDMVMVTFESYCQIVFQVIQAQGLTQKLDVDLFRYFALFMLKCFETNMARVVASPFFG